MDFKSISKKYRPIPFWSWNERLRTDETVRQVKLMDEAGLGGYFMHARGGLLTEYMGEEWFDNVKATCEEGAARGMRSFAYDENGWPSGFGDGRLLVLGEDYLQKNLVKCPSDKFSGEPSRVVCEKGGYTYYYDVNELYVDLLNPTVTDRFIEEIYEEYRRRCGDEIEGFFTDEPQLIRSTGYPWSIVTAPEFKKRCGYDLISVIDSLFFEVGDYVKVRRDYWKMTTELFSENYFKRLYDWCEKYGYKLTGHLVCDEALEGILISNGAAMPHYEYFQIPGVDWLGRPIFHSLLPSQLGSVAAQTGKEQVLTESFALTGHNVSMAELKKIFEWQAVKGINLLCTHLEGYSNRGIRKRDYPAAIYYQQPWWDDAKIFFDTISRISKIMTEGKCVADTLVIHPMSATWAMYDGTGYTGEAFQKIKSFDRAFGKQLEVLDNKHILYHLGDEILMERHGSVSGGTITVGKMTYRRVIIPDGAMLLDNTKRLIDEFVSSGGEITTFEDIAPNSVTEENALSYAKREYDGFDLHYFVNLTEEPISASFSVGNKMINAETGEETDFFGEYTLAPLESIILTDDGKGRGAAPAPKKETPLALPREWRVKGASYNSLTLDRCDYYFDGELIAERGYVLDILPRINELRRPVRLRQTYRFMIEEMPEGEIFLTTETPEIFDITVNGKPLSKRDAGDFRDISFRRLPMRELLTLGENTVEFNSTISQSEKTYEHIGNSWTCETMSNCLSYDIEIEPIYIVGDFGVKILAECEELERDAYRVRELTPSGGHSFAITKAPTEVDITRLDASGYPEFAGTLTLECDLDVTDTEKYVTLLGRGMNSVHLAVNGEHIATRMFPPYDVSLSGVIKSGKNTLELKLINNLRNMQGPLHLKEGECISVGRNRFYRESNVLSHKRGATESCHDVLDMWCDDICLVHYGLII